MGINMLYIFFESIIGMFDGAIILYISLLKFLAYMFVMIVYQDLQNTLISAKNVRIRKVNMIVLLKIKGIANNENEKVLCL